MQPRLRAMKIYVVHVGNNNKQFIKYLIGRFVS